MCVLNKGARGGNYDYEIQRKSNSTLQLHELTDLTEEKEELLLLSN